MLRLLPSPLNPLNSLPEGRDIAQLSIRKLCYKPLGGFGFMFFSSGKNLISFHPFWEAEQWLPGF